MSEADDDFLNPALRADLVQLANDPDIEQIWANIEKARGKQSKLVMRLFIREILIAKRLADASSLADLQVSLERAASVLEQKIQCSSTEKPTLIARLVCATLRGPGTGVPSSSDCPITPCTHLRQAIYPGGM